MRTPTAHTRSAPLHRLLVSTNAQTLDLALGRLLLVHAVFHRGLGRFMLPVLKDPQRLRDVLSCVPATGAWG